MGRLYRRTKNGSYYGEWQDWKTKLTRRESLRTRDKTVALERLRERELRATDRAAHSKETLSDAIGFMLAVVEQENAVHTWRFYRSKAGHLMRVLGDVAIASIDRTRCMQYVAVRKQEGAAANTVIKELTTLRRVLGEARNRETWTGDLRQVIPTLKTDYVPRSRFLTRHEFVQLMQRLPPKRQLWAAVACYAGLRRSEVEGLQWSDFHGATIHVRATKTKPRDVPVAQGLVPFLAGGNGPVVEPWGNVVRDLAVACQAARVAPATPNDLRRTFGSWLAQSGSPAYVIAKLMGNSVRMVERVYGHLLVENYQAAIAGLPDLSDETHCALFVRRPVTLGDTNGTERSFSAGAKSRESLTVVVPRDGIEPPTRGFSVLKKSNQVRKLVRR